VTSGCPRGAPMLEDAEQLSSRFYMAMPIAKDAARGWSESVKFMRQYLPFELPPTRSMAEVLYLLRQVVEEHAEEEPSSAVAALFALTSDGYLPRTHQRTAELGYMLGRDSWGRGIAAEAARLLLDFAFGELGLHRVFAVVDEDNPASIRVVEKLGLRREARH